VLLVASLGTNAHQNFWSFLLGVSLSDPHVVRSGQVRREPQREQLSKILRLASFIIEYGLTARG